MKADNVQRENQRFHHSRANPRANGETPAVSFAAKHPFDHDTSHPLPPQVGAVGRKTEDGSGTATQGSASRRYIPNYPGLG